jgi:hypothetical protein
MYHSILQVFKREYLTAGSYITFFEPISFQNAILTSHEHVASDIKFPFIIQKRILYIQLTENKLFDDMM